MIKLTRHDPNKRITPEMRSGLSYWYENCPGPYLPRVKRRGVFFEGLDIPETHPMYALHAYESHDQYIFVSTRGSERFTYEAFTMRYPDIVNRAIKILPAQTENFNRIGVARTPVLPRLVQERVMDTVAASLMIARGVPIDTTEAQADLVEEIASPGEGEQPAYVFTVPGWTGEAVHVQHSHSLQSGRVFRAEAMYEGEQVPPYKECLTGIDMWMGEDLDPQAERSISEILGWMVLARHLPMSTFEQTGGYSGVTA